MKFGRDEKACVFVMSLMMVLFFVSLYTRNSWWCFADIPILMGYWLWIWSREDA